MPHRYITTIDPSLPRIAVDLGYSANSKSCAIAHSLSEETEELFFGECIDATAQILKKTGPATLILEAVLSTYHRADGNPDIRGSFEKGRGWYYGPGVSTFAAAIRFLSQLNKKLPRNLPVSLVEGFLSYKPRKTEHTEDAFRLLKEFDTAECFSPCSGSLPILKEISSPPEIRRYNPRPTESSKPRS
ncbi:MAG: hypothetical protein AAGH40_01855 [Verrucomicrobiota bacterium]